jgi:hypothetical protein
MVRADIYSDHCRSIPINTPDNTQWFFLGQNHNVFFFAPHKLAAGARKQ